MPDEIDILEDHLLHLDPKVLDLLLTDHSRKPSRCHGRSPHTHIIWATSDYAHYGEAYGFHQPITASLITGMQGHLIQPRVCKSREVQKGRARQRAEVFTPAWVCNAQNNLVDEAWFGRADVFNRPLSGHGWQPTEGPIVFPKGKTWEQYVRAPRMEMSCGEAPYLTSRYDAATGRAIPFAERIGLLDRKLRIVGEHCNTTSSWLRYARLALKSIYAFEWQGDSLLIARENLLQTFVDAYRHKFGSEPMLKSVIDAATIISWNIVQMDGLKFVVPESCFTRQTGLQLGLFSKPSSSIVPCKGCATGNHAQHNGIVVYVKDWTTRRAISFRDLVRK